MAEKKDFREQVKVRKSVAGLCGLLILALGAIVVLWASFQMSFYSELLSDDHMTDPAIPYNELENATYTFENEWLMEKVDGSLFILLFGAMLFVPGYIIFVFAESLFGDKMMHREFCKGSSEGKYCPECGLKLSRLEKD